METKANYVLIGAFTIVIAAALLLFGLWAAKYSSERSWQEYQVVFREAVTGLSVGSPVQYNGIAVGSITKLSLAPNDPRQVVARIVQKLHPGGYLIVGHSESLNGINNTVQLVRPTIYRLPLAQGKA